MKLPNPAISGHGTDFGAFKSARSPNAPASAIKK
jgi:hypothetical protein